MNASYYAVGTFVENYTAAQLRAVLPATQQWWPKQGVAEPTIFVWSAGNDQGDPCSPLSAENCVADPGDPSEGHYDATSPNVLGGAVALLPELQGHNVVVVALAEDGSIADYSNRCGIAADWCIAAPGSGIIGAYFGPQGTGVARGVGGTSYASPLVTGGLALMKQLFRNQLSHQRAGHQTLCRPPTRVVAIPTPPAMVRERSTSGPPSPRSALPGSGPVTGSTIPARASRPPGSGWAAPWATASARAAAGLELAAFDDLGAPFWFELPGLTDLAGTPSSLERLRELMTSSGTDADPKSPTLNSLLDLAGATTTTRVASGLELKL